ncbi:hypothetical protein [Flavobacterium sp.]|uniref:hypothetical protein n=1 Tax=Flavobacterium sp. TaxID=239 RepID=UPI00248A732B|nr:hypothetical protein [Flavobacterium sp.]MDI1315986.1 hypothetical protein [Flavobacterium sp.]
MKKLIFILFLLFQLSTFGQTVKVYEQKLNHLIEKRNYWMEENEKKFQDIASDSMSYYNTAFEKSLLRVTAKNQESIQIKFKTLQENYINILTSSDGNFRIYSWDTFEGGTMHFYRNILQFKTNGKVYSEIYTTDFQDNSCSFYDLNQVTSKNKNYYITSSVMVGSSAVYYYEAKVFSIENKKLNRNASLIKTTSGMKNTVGYDIDFSSEANRNDTSEINKFEYMSLDYDKKNKIILLALLTEDGIVTSKKIKYKFNGVYFEKMISNIK